MIVSGVDLVKHFFERRKIYVVGSQKHLFFSGMARHTDPRNDYDLTEDQLKLLELI